MNKAEHTGAAHGRNAARHGSPLMRTLAKVATMSLATLARAFTTAAPRRARARALRAEDTIYALSSVSYTHLTLPTKRIV